MPTELGKILKDRYRIDALLGEGGMGAVYRALDTRTGSQVAVKENLTLSMGNSRRALSTALRSEYERMEQQFTAEAGFLQRLDHPGLPKVIDHFVLPDAGQYLVMEYIDGQDLQTLVKQAGAIGEERVVAIGVETCQILEYLHSQNPPVVHRDIKPGNLRVTPDGKIVLVDFGISKQGVGRLTTMGARAVSEGFSSPEQYGGSDGTDARSDIYSLSATLYALLAGEAPPSATDRVVGKNMPRVSELSNGCDEALATALEKGLQLRPADRFQSADQFRASLVEARDRSISSMGMMTRKMESPPANQADGGRIVRPRRLSLPIAILGILVVPLFVGATWRASQPLHPLGDVLHEGGDLEHPGGDPQHPEGDIAHPNGDGVEHPGGHAEHDYDVIEANHKTHDFDLAHEFDTEHSYDTEEYTEYVTKTRYEEEEDTQHEYDTESAVVGTLHPFDYQHDPPNPDFDGAMHEFDTGPCQHPCPASKLPIVGKLAKDCRLHNYDVYRCGHALPCNHQISCRHERTESRRVPCVHKVTRKRPIQEQVPQTRTRRIDCRHHIECQHKVECVHLSTRPEQVPCRHIRKCNHDIPCNHRVSCVHVELCKHLVPCKHIQGKCVHKRGIGHLFSACGEWVPPLLGGGWDRRGEDQGGVGDF